MLSAAGGALWALPQLASSVVQDPMALLVWYLQSDVTLRTRRTRRGCGGDAACTPPARSGH